MKVGLRGAMGASVLDVVLPHPRPVGSGCCIALQARGCVVADAEWRDKTERERERGRETDRVRETDREREREREKQKSIRNNKQTNKYW